MVQTRVTLWLTYGTVTGGTAAAAGSLVKQLGGNLMGYVFILELDFLKGRAKLDAPAHTLLSSQHKWESYTTSLQY